MSLVNAVAAADVAAAAGTVAGATKIARSLTDWAATRLDRVPKSTVWHEFTSLSLEHKAVNLGQGFPSFSPEPFVIANTVAAVTDEHPFAHQYCRGLGHLKLAEVLKDMYTERLNRAITINDILVMNGTTQCLNCAFVSIINPGDEVIVFEPFFDLYANDIEMAGGVVKYVPMTTPHERGGTANDWVPNWTILEKHLASGKVKALIVNSPQNVPGKVWSLDELNKIAALAIQHDFLVVSDEVYQSLTYDGCVHHHIAALPGMWERTLTMCSAGKTFAVTGWKIGWVVAPAPMIAFLNQTHAHQAFSVSTPLQVAVAQSFLDAKTNGYYERLTAQYLAKRELLCRVLSEAGLTPTMPQGSFFALADITSIAPHHYMPAVVNPADDVGRDWHFCRWLCKNIGVTAIPMTAFCTKESRPVFERFARFAFCKTEQQISEAGERLKRLSEFTK